MLITATEIAHPVKKIVIKDTNAFYRLRGIAYLATFTRKHQ